jgi:transposase
MKREEAIAILDLPREEAIQKILELGRKAEKHDKLFSDISPSTPSGMKPVYTKPPGKKRRRKPGRKKGHLGTSRPRPEKIDKAELHTLSNCPYCETKLGKSIKNYKRYVEDIPPVEPEVTEHTVCGYWCPTCKKVVWAKITASLKNSQLGLRVVVFTAWLHYLVGVSVSNIVKLLKTVACYNVTPGGLTQAWKNLALHLEPVYDAIGEKIADSAVLYGDETGHRINGVTHWLWGFATKAFCYYVIDRSRGSPVVKMVLGKIFKGILVCDFWGAYNKLCALAKQRCFYHLFTELVKVDKKNSSACWKAFRKTLCRLLRDAVRLSQRKQKMSKADYERRKNRLYKRLESLLIIQSDDKDVKRLLKRLRRHKDELFTFLEYEGVSPYNNHAEQQMRRPAITRKISQQNRSKLGAKVQAILMTLFQSAQLQKLNPVETILQIAKNLIDPKNETATDLQENAI